MRYLPHSELKISDKHEALLQEYCGDTVYLNLSARIASATRILEQTSAGDHRKQNPEPSSCSCTEAVSPTNGGVRAGSGYVNRNNDRNPST